MSEVKTINRSMIHQYDLIKKVAEATGETDKKVWDLVGYEFEDFYKNGHYDLFEHPYCYFVVHNKAFKPHNIWTTKLYEMVTKEKFLNWVYIADEDEKDALFISGSFRAFMECFNRLVKYMSIPLAEEYSAVFGYLERKENGKAHNKSNTCDLLTRDEFIKEAKRYKNHPEILYRCLPHTVLIEDINIEMMLNISRHRLISSTINPKANKMVITATEEVWDHIFNSNLTSNYGPVNKDDTFKTYDLIAYTLRDMFETYKIDESLRKQYDVVDHTRIILRG